jgi:hypothetical protein
MKKRLLVWRDGETRLLHVTGGPVPPHRLRAALAKVNALAAEAGPLEGTRFHQWSPDPPPEGAEVFSVPLGGGANNSIGRLTWRPFAALKREEG